MESVVSAREAYPGENQHLLPDLFAVWAREGPITGAMSPSIGTLTAAAPGYRTGNHVLGGFYVGVGPGVSPGHHHRTGFDYGLSAYRCPALEHRAPG